ncbi:MAG: SHOCT domain-containing protein [Thermoleophilia bacterium]|jgi:hypothetical protein|nr:SHOCT domain-containing protein [Thermoleophilia bacterium]
MIDPDSQDQFRRAARELGQELQRTMEQAGRMFRQAVQDFSPPPGARPPRPAGPPPPPGAAGDPVELIRRLGELRDQGYISTEEFEAKKRDLLDRIG